MIPARDIADEPITQDQDGVSNKRQQIEPVKDHRQRLQSMTTRLVPAARWPKLLLAYLADKGAGP